MNHTATYSPEDNKLRLYPASRLDSELYARVRGAGFIWAPKQELFVAPAWTPSRENLLIELCGEIGDEDTSLVDRAEDRAERFEGYSESRAEDAERAREAVDAIAHNIPMGQPILVGHHSEKHARKDAERIENGMRKAVKMWETSKYWQSRAAGAIRNAKYKELPAVRARRIKGIEADKRKQERVKADCETFLKVWSKEGLTLERATHIANYERGGAVTLSNGESYHSAWSALDSGKITAEEVQKQRIESLPKNIAYCDRWINHFENRLAYERAMLAAAGGTVADRNAPQKGGGCKCWASHRGGWSYIQKVNKVSVTVLDNWGNGGSNFTRTIPFDKLSGVLSPAEVEKARAEKRLHDYEDKTGFFLIEPSSELPETAQPEQPAKRTLQNGAQFDALRATLKAGVQVITAPQLFPTPPELATRMVELAEIESAHKVLEPSAGTGNLLRAIRDAQPEARVTAVEINRNLSDTLSAAYNPRPAGWAILADDFLSCNGNLGKFDRVVMNPPFQNADDIRHIEHALTMLNPGGRLVALCANGPRQTAKLQPIADTWEELPADTFKDAGTGVRAVLMTITRES